jgi:DNA-binding NarL/FixJ family response regulator
MRIWVENNRDQTSRRVRFTPRETEVLRAVADGLTSKEIGVKLHMAPRTVDTHLTTVQEKLQADNRTQALCKAVNLGLLQPDETLDVQQLSWISGSSIVSIPGPNDDEGVR